MLIHRLRRSVAMLTLAAFSGLSLFMILGLSPSRNDPFHAPYIDNQMHSIAANSDTWFRFDYGLVSPPRTVVTLAIVNGAQSGLGFEVWAPEIISQWWQEKPTGQGMVLAVDCTTGTLLGGGGCQSKDLMWIGAFGGAGTYYVRVINRTSSPSQFLLTIQGTSVSPAPTPTPSSARTLVFRPTTTRAVGRVVPTPSRTPTMMALPTPYDDPYHAAPLDGQLHALPGNSATWYKFDYGIAGNFQYRPRVGLRLVGAAGTGVGFEIWSPETLPEWWLRHPVGRGSLEVTFNCAFQGGPTETPFPSDQSTPTSTPTSTPAPTGTPAPEAICTHTPTNNLTWFGAFGGPGTYYVRVVNDSTENVSTDTAVAPQLIISGAGLAQCANPAQGNTESVPSSPSGDQGFAAVDCSGMAGPTPIPTPTTKPRHLSSTNPFSAPASTFKLPPLISSFACSSLRSITLRVACTPRTCIPNVVGLSE